MGFNEDAVMKGDHHVKRKQIKARKKTMMDF